MLAQEQAKQLESIFMPFARREREKCFPEDPMNPTTFVHYTSAEAALRIIKSKRLWMRNTTCMADYREVQHGFDILNSFFSDQNKRQAFVDALEACAPGSAGEAIDLFNRWLPDIRLNTYIASVSRHHSKEDRHGRLSMWRAFGGNLSRVAIVLKVPEFSLGADALNLIFSPVAYFTAQEVHDELQLVIHNICDNADFLKSIGRSQVIGYVFDMLASGVACLKHQGFGEEQEWRAIYSPHRSPSTLMQCSTEIIGGVPQIVYKVPLDETVSNVLSDLDVRNIFDRLIIGPTQYPWVMYDAFVKALVAAGIPDADKRVWPSDIPIRS
jgi:hypothetical protein